MVATELDTINTAQATKAGADRGTVPRHRDLGGTADGSPCRSNQRSAASMTSALGVVPLSGMDQS